MMGKYCTGLELWVQLLQDMDEQRLGEGWELETLFGQFLKEHIHAFLNA